MDPLSPHDEKTGAAEATPAVQDRIAIIGMSGRYPGADSLEAYWDNLGAGRDCVEEVPPSRWDVQAHFDPVIPSPGKTYGKWLGSLGGVECFDPLFFNIAPAEAQGMDPQQRLFLEESYRAFEDAGYDPLGLGASRCGVYLGISGSEYGALLQQRRGVVDFTGCSPAVAAARIAYFLDLKGPAIPVDTACSSSLVAVHLACQALRNGEVDLALAGGVALYLTPEMYVCMSAAGALSPRGRCRTLDNQADGFVPGEGVGALVLKRLVDAERDGDPIHGVIVGSGVNQDGRSNGLTAPNEDSQVALAREVYQRHGIAPASIGYVELHGTGTKLGDPIELNALSSVFREKTGKLNFCGLGSVKSNIGHTSAAAGVAGLHKVLLQMRHRELVPTLHYTAPNEHFDQDLAQSPFFVCTARQPWGAVAGQPLRAAVSSFGISGTNAHLVVDAYHGVPSRRARHDLEAEQPVLIVLSARRVAQLKACAAQLKAFVERTVQVDWPALAYTLQVGRAALEHRLALVATSREQLVTALGEFSEGRDPVGVLTADIRKRRENGTGLGDTLATQAATPASLREVGAQWVNGVAIDWASLYGEGRPQRLALPTYPFARERYWIEAVEATAGTGPAPLHPLIQRNSSRLGEQRFSTVLRGDESFLEDHRVAGKPVLPGAAQLEWARAAVALAHGLPVDHPVVLEEVVWLRPLEVQEALEVHIGIQQDAGYGVNYTLYSEADAQAGRILYSQGRARVDDLAGRIAPRVDLETLRASCERTMAGTKCYERFAQLGLHYGPSFQVLEMLDMAEELVVATLRGKGERQPYGLPPTLIDGALQASLGLSVDGALALPFAVQRLEQWGAVPDTVWAVVRAGRGAPGDLDIELADATGQVVVRLTGFACRPLAGTSVAHDERGVELTLAPTWTAITECVDVSAETMPTPPGVEIDAQMDQRQLTLDGEGAWLSWLQAQGAVDHLVWQVPGEQRWASRAAFQLVKALLALGYGTRPLHLMVVTRQAFAVMPDEASDPFQASVHGLVGSLAKEYPDWRVNLIDLAREEQVVPWQWLANRVRVLPGETLAYREGTGYRQQLLPCRLAPEAQPVFRHGGVYVILGGAGGIGEAFTEHLIRRYQAQVVWLGRRPEDAAIAQQCQRLAALGPRPWYLQADGRDRGALTTAAREIQARHGSVQGVVHAAMVLADRSLARMDEQTFEAAVAAKLETAVNLDAVFGDGPLDLMLYFSSLQSVLRAAGQGNYAAGCCFVDEFARGLKRPYPVKRVQWGYWGTTGAVATDDYRGRMAQAGIGSIEAPHAMAWLERWLAGPVDCLALAQCLAPETAPAWGVAQDLKAAIAPAAPMVTLPQPSAIPPDAALLSASQALERHLKPLLQAMLYRQGWLDGHQGLSARYGQWREVAARMVDDGGPDTDMADWAPRWSAWETYRAQELTLGAQVALADKTLRALPDVLAGTREATEVLFPQGRLDLVEAVYRGHPLADHFNTVLGERLAAYVQARLALDPHVRLRILEIGAGTGGTSSRLFERLGAYAAQVQEYVYTDVSPAFLEHAHTHFAPRVSYLNTRLLDIEQAPGHQGFELGHYDVVLAANVLHATRDVAKTLRHVKSLLKANGLLLLNETIQSSLFAHLTFGLLPGWWRAEDAHLRIPGTPLLSTANWRQVLKAEGFLEPCMPAQAAHGLGQAIIMATSDGLVRLDEQHQVEPEASPAPSVVADRAPATLVIQVEEAVTALVASHLRIDRQELDRDRAFGELGFDSITSTSFTRLLNERYGLKMGPSVLFETPTIAALAARLVREYPAQLAPAFAAAQARRAERPSVRWAPQAVASPQEGQQERGARRDQESTPEPIAVIGMSGRFPQAEDIEALWANLEAGRDCIGELAPERFATQAWPRIRHAGVLEGLAAFDPAFFNISRREAQGMDPQHRLLMMYVYKVIEDAGYSVQSLSGSNTALLVGTGASGYAQLLARSGEEASVASAVGTAVSMGPNRMSYWLNWHGPSEPVDTACSSSLVAVHRAMALLRSGECDQAVVGGVNTLLAWDVHESMAQAGVLSPDGRCKAFSAQADGFVRGEGVAMLMLKPLSAAQRDGDPIHGLLLGSAQNHGGQANSLTAPNPLAQAKVVETALREARIDPRSIGYIEAHGTGTVLGDPIEIQGLKHAFRAVMGEAALPEQSIGLGSLKSNIGHLELAAGVAGVIKVLLQMRQGCLVQSLNSQPLNPQIDFAGSPFYVVSGNRPWPQLADGHGGVLPRRAGVSSFGFGGVNAHVVLEQYCAPRPATGGDEPVLVVLSARDAAGLDARVVQLSAWLDHHTVDLASLAYTLQVGREAMKARLAFVADSLDGVRERLSACIREQGLSSAVYRGEIRRDQGLHALFQGDEDLQETACRLIAQGKLERLAQWWVSGLEIDWARLWGERKPLRINLPTYPFAKEHCWVEQRNDESPVRPTQDKPQGLPLQPVQAQASAPAPKVARQDSCQDSAVLVERVLSETLAQALRIDVGEIDPDELLSERGLDSIVAVEWIRDINKRYAILLNTSKVYEFPTIRQMARLVLQTCEGAQQTDLVTPAQGTAEVAPAGAPAMVTSDSLAAVDTRRLEEALTDSLAQSLRIDGNEIDPDRLLSEIGLDSIVAVEWIRDINKRYAILLNTSKVYEYPTIRQLAACVGQLLEAPDHGGQSAVTSAAPAVASVEPQAIPRAPDLATMEVPADDTRQEQATRVFASQLRLETLIDADTLDRAASCLAPVGSPVRQVLLTGANGFVGRFLALSLAEQLAPRVGTLYCMVRAPSDAAARQRLLDSLAASPLLARRLVDFEQAGRLVVLAGDLSKPRFGLAAPVWELLAQQVDAIVHSAAQVNHMLAYNQLHGANVHGTAQVIRLAISGKPKAINFLSSVAVGTGLRRDAPIGESETALDLYDSCIGAGRYAAGYGASKWAGEVLLQQAAERWGLPVRVFRCGMLLPHSTLRGFVNLEDVFSRFLVSLTGTGIAPPSFQFARRPGETSVFRGVPVDVAARSIAGISLGEERGYVLYHVLSDRNDAPSLDQLVQWVRELGHPIVTAASTEAWQQAFAARLEALNGRTRAYSLYSSIYQLDDLKDLLNQPEFDTRNFAEKARLLEGLPADGGAVSSIDRGFISNYLTELGQAGLIAQPL